MMQAILNTVQASAMDSLVALAFALTFAVTRVIHLPFATTYALAAYVFLLAYEPLGPAVAAALAVASALGVGFTSELVVYRPLLRRNASIAVVTIGSAGLLFLGEGVLHIVFGPNPYSVTSPLQQRLPVEEVVLTGVGTLKLVLPPIVIAIVLVAVERTNLGKRLRAVAAQPRLAALVGMNVAALRIAAISAGSALAAVAAIVNSLDYGYYQGLGIPILLTAFVATVLGGIGSLFGAVAAGFGLGIVTGITAWFAGGQWENMAAYVVFILVLLVRPGGFVPESARARAA
jgi:branched-chain amino acid transport system permease protein